MRLLFFLLLAGSAGAAESDGHALLRRGIALQREASFAASVAALEQARARGPLSPSESAECAYWLATGYLALGSTLAARRELRALVAGSPHYELPPYTSPKVAALYRDVKEEWEHAPRLKALPPKTSVADEGRERALAIAFEPSRMGGLAYGALYWRWRGEREFTEVPLGHQDENLIGHMVVGRGGTLEYYAEARAPEGVAQAGSPERPLELPVAAPPVQPIAPVARHDKPPLAKNKWLWISLGAVSAAGLGVGLYFALRPQPTSTADAVLDFGVR